MIFLRKFVPLFVLLFWPSDWGLWFTMNLISEKPMMNTCKMFTLTVDFLTASLPRIPGHMVFSLYFGLAVSSTMGSAFLDHVVRDRDCIQSYFEKLSSGFAVNQALSASAVHNSLIPIKKTVRIVLLEKFCTTRKTPHYPIRGSSHSNCCWIGYRRYSAASRLEVLLDEMTFDLFDELLNSDMFCFFYKWVWQSWHSEINVVFLLLIHRDGSPRTCLISVDMFTCQHATFGGFVSTYGLTVLVGSVTLSCFLIKSVAIKLGTFQGFLTPFCNRSPCTW